MGTTRLQLFRDIASELGDLIVLAATAAGTPTTFIAANDMLWPDSGLNGREAWYAEAQSASASNRQTRRLVMETNEDTASIEVRPAWPAAPEIGDVLYLVNSRGTGVTIPDIHDKINQLIRRVADQLAEEVAGTPATFAVTAPAIAIPDGWDYVLGLQYEPSAAIPDVWENCLGHTYYYQKWDRTATVKSQYRHLYAGKRVRLIGAVSLDPLTDDEDTTTAPASWLAKVAARELAEAAYERSGAADLLFTFGELLKSDVPALEQRVGKRFPAVGKRYHLGRR